MKSMKNKPKSLDASVTRIICWCFTGLFLATVVSSSAAAKTFVYVANGGSNSVSVIDTVHNTVVATIPVSSGPSDVAVTPDGDRAYVTIAPSNSVSVIDTVANTVIATIPITLLAGVAVTPDGTRAYVTSRNIDTVSVIDTASNNVTATIAEPAGSLPFFLAFTPDGTRAYVVNNSAPGSVAVIDTDPSSPTYNMIIATLSAGTFPARVAPPPDGTLAYVSNGLSA